MNGMRASSNEPYISARDQHSHVSSTVFQKEKEDRVVGSYAFFMLTDDELIIQGHFHTCLSVLLRTHTDFL